MTTETKLNVFRAGQLDGEFRDRALRAGGPYTTASLLTLGRETLPQITIDNALGRAARFLTAAEATEWRSIVQQLVGRAITDSDRCAYALGEMAGISRD